MDGKLVPVEKELSAKGYIIIKNIRPEVLKFAQSVNQKLDHSDIKKIDKWSFLDTVDQDVIQLVTSLRKAIK